MATVEQQTESGAGEGNGKAEGIPVENPATGAIIAHVPIVEPAAIAGVVERARAAQPAWEALGFEGRARIFRRAQKWVTDNADRIIETIGSETGKVYEDAQLGEVGYAASAFGFWAKHAPEYLADEKVRTSNPFVAGKKLVVRYAPVGVVGVIGPWNFPLTNSFGDCLPALMAGNTVVLKPSEITPLTSLLMRDAMQECGLPEDVLQVVPGYGETGAELIDHVDYVMFTGSTRTGKKVMERASKTLTPVSLELGGKDPMIVCADADLERAANAAITYGMINAGQVCISTERVYVEAPIYDEFVAKVTEKASKLRQGVPAGPGSQDLGAVIFPPQFDIVEGHVKDAQEAGAKVLTGGKGRRENGRFFEPTVLVDVDHSMACMREETFGPTLPIMKVDDIEQALELANDTEYGLAASVFTKDAAKGEAIARRVQAGAVCVNDAMLNYFALELPMGGWKSSGLGTRHGVGGIRKYCRQQTLLVTRFAPLKKDPIFMPYSSKITKGLGKAVKLLYGRGKRA